VIVAIVATPRARRAVVIARRGKMKLATEIAISSSAQVGLLVSLWSAGVLRLRAPARACVQPIELIAMGGAARFVGFVIRDGAPALEGHADRRLRGVRGLVPSARQIERSRRPAPIVAPRQVRAVNRTTSGL